jgi:hypothetical protein
MRKLKIAKIYALEKKLTTLKKIKCSADAKRKLRKAARDWINYINIHMNEINHPFYNLYHRGEINAYCLFFNIKEKKKGEGKRK